MTNRAWLAGIAFFLATTTARADGVQSSSLTVLPTNGAFIKISESEKRAFIQIANSISSFRYNVALSAPLDGDTRRAAFTDDEGLAPGVAGNASFVFSSALHDLATEAGRDSFKRGKLCVEFNEANPTPPGEPIPACTGSKYDEWLRERLVREVSKEWIPLPDSSRFFFEAGADVSASYDRMSAYSGDVATSQVSISKSDIKLNGVFRVYWAPWLALTLKPGVEWSKAPRTRKFTRCSELKSGDAAVTGRSCDDTALFLRSSPPLSISGTVQATLTAIAPISITKANPGAEASLGWDAVGGIQRRRLTLTSFLAPTTQPVVTRFGVGVEMTEALDDDPDGAFVAGKKWWTPFLIVGGTL